MPNLTVSTDIDAFLASATKVAARKTLNTWIKKTTTYTAVAGDRLQLDSTGGAFTVTLPAAAIAGDEIFAEDAALTWGTNNITFDRNGLNINGGTDDYSGNVDGGKLSIIYVDVTIGWSIK